MLLASTLVGKRGMRREGGSRCRWGAMSFDMARASVSKDQWEVWLELEVEEKASGASTS